MKYAILLLVMSAQARAAFDCQAQLRNYTIAQEASDEIIGWKFLGPEKTEAVIKATAKMREFERNLEEMEMPVVHGTTSELLPSILRDGLRPHPPEVRRAASPQFISVSNLRM